MIFNPFINGLSFPLEKESKDLQKEGKLKINSKVGISSGLMVYWKNHAHVQNIVIAAIIGSVVRIITEQYFGKSELWGFISFVIVFTTIDFILDFWLRQERSEYLGSLNSNDSLREFLDKFAQGLQEKSWKHLIKIITFGKVKTKNWRIEYGLLVLACKLSKDNPRALSEAVKKCRNKKEFRQVTAVI